jgi:acetylornithine deacetylase/succinyl-diaminopimelate desuccinylase-like protein
LAGLLALVRALKCAPPWTGLTASPVFVANVGEEGDGNLSGMRHLCTQSPLASKIRCYLVLDGPSIEHITCEALACRRYEVAITGQGGHSWIDHGMANPVHALAKAITLFTSDVPAVHSACRYAFNFGMIDGGVSVNAIPTSARARLDLRSTGETMLEQLGALLEASVAQACSWENERSPLGKVAAKIREAGSRPGGFLPPGSGLMRAVTKVDEFLGIPSAPDCSSTDANIPLSMGIPAVSLGAGGSGGGAHTPQEWFRPEGRDLGLQRLLLVLALLLAE